MRELYQVIVVKRDESRGIYIKEYEDFNELLDYIGISLNAGVEYTVNGDEEINESVGNFYRSFFYDQCEVEIIIREIDTETGVGTNLINMYYLNEEHNYITAKELSEIVKYSSMEEFLLCRLFKNCFNDKWEEFQQKFVEYFKS
jgi:hypothetical protein